jgi:hypothetical protein
VIGDATGNLVYVHSSPSLAAGTSIDTVPAAVRTALRGGRCERSAASVSGGCGVELLADGSPAYVIAVPVIRGGGTVGVVAYVAPLSYQLTRFQALFNFPTAFVSARRTDLEFRPTLGQTAVVDPSLRAALGQPGSVYRAIYRADRRRRYGGRCRQLPSSLRSRRSPDGIHRCRGAAVAVRGR